MASSFTTAAVSLFLIVAAACGVAGDVGTGDVYKVGGREGWQMPEKTESNLYSDWASRINFHVGDSIVFEYRNDSVVKVDKRVYYHCNQSRSDPMFTDGKTVFVLDNLGFYYFVSSDLEHCRRGQRLMIEVMDSPKPYSAAPSPSMNPSNAFASCSISLRGIIVCLGAFLICSIF